MSHIALMTHKPFVAVVTSEREVPGVSPLVPYQLVTVTELLLTVFTCVPEKEKEVLTNI